MHPSEIEAVTLRRTIAAPVDRVWRAWTDPATVARWFSPNADLEVVADTGGQVGDTWSVVMGRYAVRGVHVEVAPPHRLAFTWAFDHEPDAAPTLVEVDLRPFGDGTSIVVTHSSFTDSSDRDGVGQGWALSLDRLIGLDL